MTRLLNPKLSLIILFFILLRFIDAPLIFKGIFFIFLSHILIYLNQKTLSKKFILFLIFFSLLFIVFNEKKNITEVSYPLKLTSENENIYFDLLGEDQLTYIKPFFNIAYPDCYQQIDLCFQNSTVDKNPTISSDQIIFSMNKTISRKVSFIDFDSLSNARASFINSREGNINRHNLDKFDTPYFLQYSNISNLDKICFRGFVYINFKNGNTKKYNSNNLECISEQIETLTGFNLKGKRLEIHSSNTKINDLIDEFFLIIFTVLILMNINLKTIKNDLKLFIPILLSVFIIFYISRYDLWFHVFDLFNIYFFGFEGGDSNVYINFAYEIYNSLINYDLVSVFRGGESEFYFTPGLRYFLVLNNIISGDFYYFYFYVLFYLPKILNKYLENQFGIKAAYWIMLSFLLLPVLHHLGFSYYQYFRHSYRLFPEPLGYMFFIYGLTIFFSDYKEKYLRMNLFFALSVFFRPNLVLSVVILLLFKTINERLNLFHFKNCLILFLIGLIYLFPLLHNLYFANTFTLFTGYGSKIFNLSNLLSKDLNYFIDKIYSINFVFLFLIFIPKLDFYLKAILLTQYVTIFLFDSNNRYYWIYWMISLNLIYIIISKYYTKWKFQKKFTSN